MTFTVFKSLFIKYIETDNKKIAVEYSIIPSSLQINYKQNWNSKTKKQLIL